MHTHRELTHQRHLQGLESPQTYRDRQSLGSDFNQISPIPNLHQQETKDLFSMRKGEQARSKERHHLLFEGPQVVEFGKVETPTNLLSEFYKRPTFVESNGTNNFYGEELERYQRELQRKETLIAQTTGNQIKYNSNKDSNPSCSQFDLTAKEIPSGKRIDQFKQKTLISGGRKTDQSPNDPSSNTETVKWAFSKDSQETQKKVSVINRESTTNFDHISKSLKSYDSKPFQPKSASNVIQNLKGKMLDFGSVPQTEEAKETLMFFSQMNSDKNHVKQEEGKLISFLEGASEMLQSSLKKRPTHLMPELKNLKFLTQKRSQLAYRMQQFIDNSIDCQLCHEHQTFDSDNQQNMIVGPCSLQHILKQNLDKKYLTSKEYYNVKIINDIIYNEQTRVVSVFKDYLIYDDISEFMKRYYLAIESHERLPRMFEFYEKYSKVFPNYVTLPENKYLFKNIEKKQKLIDEKNRYLQEKQEKAFREQNGFDLGRSAGKNSKHKDRFSSHNISSEYSQFSTNRLFDTKFIDSVANIQPSGVIDQSMQSSKHNQSLLKDHLQNSSLLIQQQLQQNMENLKKKRQKKALQDMDFDELISKFIAKDTQSNIQSSSLLSDSELKQNQEAAQTARPSAQATQKKPTIYEYQQKQPLQPSMVQSDNSKTLSVGDNPSSGRPTSTKIPSQSKIPEKQRASRTNNQNLEGKVLNYNIYNNYNQYINNENYYISTHENLDKPNVQILQDGASNSRPASLKRSQSRSNLHGQEAQSTKALENDSNRSPFKPQTQKVTISPKQASEEERQRTKEQAQLIMKRLQKQKVQKQEVQNYQSHTSGSQNQPSSQSLHSPSSNFPLTSRDLSKVEIPNPLLSQITSPLVQSQYSSNQMFKNDIFRKLQANSKQAPSRQNMNLVQIQDQLNQADYLNSREQTQQMKSLERRTSVEEEIERDYSKYLNEYGLSKTAFAKAVNALREQKQTAQPVLSQPATTRKIKLVNQLSNEKRRTSNVRSGSASQTRKQSQSRQQALKKAQALESANELYMNTNNNQKQIRSVRTKTLVTSQNNSVPRSHKMSPDKQNTILSGVSQLTQLGVSKQNLTNAGSIPTFITLKAQANPDSQKAIKIKFPIKKQRGNSNNDKNGSQNQTPKRIKLQKTKSSSNIPLCFSQRGVFQNTLMTARDPREVIGEQAQTTYDQTGIKNIRTSQNMKEFNIMQQDMPLISSTVFPQQMSQSAVGTYALTSMLNSPQQFKNQMDLIGQQFLQQQKQQARNTSKGSKSSRNGTSSNHQSQKSINNNTHQRMSSNGLQYSNSKSKQSLGGADSKRLSAGSNTSKRQSGGFHQQQPSNIQQQILQLLMSYQSQQDPDNTSSSQQNLTQRHDFKLLKSGNAQSMKDLKSLAHQPTTNLVRDLNIIKAPRNTFGQSPTLVLQQSQASLNTQRQGGNQTSILMVNQHKRKNSKQGRITSRDENNQKRVIQQTSIKGYYPQNDQTQNSNFQNSNLQPNIFSHDLSSRIQSVIQRSEDQTYSMIGQKRMLASSKSQENLDLIKFAQKAALEQQQQTQRDKSDTLSQAANKFLQNLKQQEAQVSLAKLKLIPTALQNTARNAQYEQSNYQSNNENEVSKTLYSKGPTNIIIGNNFEKPQSRRTSGKFNPSSTRSNQLK